MKSADPVVDFAESYKKNKNGADGKCHILSIIAQEFTYHNL